MASGDDIKAAPAVHVTDAPVGQGPVVGTDGQIKSLGVTTPGVTPMASPQGALYPDDIIFGLKPGAPAPGNTSGEPKIVTVDNPVPGVEPGETKVETLGVPDNPSTELAATEFGEMWRSMPDEQKESMFLQNPNIGNTPGMPAVDADRFNRRRLDNEIKARSSDTYTPASDGESSLDELTDLREQLGQTDGGKPRMLLVFDPVKRRAAVSVGENPDKADNVTTYVPGTGENLGTIDRGINRAGTLLSEANRAAPRESTSVIAWYGYDAPQDIAIGDSPATDRTRARAGGPLLAAFQSGRRAARDPGSRDPQTTVLGHSYGTVVIGQAALGGQTLDADRVVLVGSPGINARYASDLNLRGVQRGENGRRVFVVNDDYDPVTYTPKTGAHGDDVGAPEFGATRVKVTEHPGKFTWSSPEFSTYYGMPILKMVEHSKDVPSFDAHSQYWDSDNGTNLSLINQGLIMVGDDPVIERRPN